MIVTGGGKNVAPATLEDPIRANPIIGQVLVVGDQKPFIAALITLDDEMLPVWLNNNGEDATMTVAEAAKNPKVLAEVQRAIDAANTKVSRAESIRKFHIITADISEASGHLTPKMSVKRHVILKEFAADIEAMYANAPATEGISTIG
jgi:long-chain acyl-CoA synthetase